MKIIYLVIFLVHFCSIGFMQAAGKEQSAMSLHANESSEPSEFALSLNNVTADVFAATLLLCNTFGRLALIGCLGYKAYRSVLKALQNKEKRLKHGVRTLCYFGASCMLLYDGYQWVLSRGA